MTRTAGPSETANSWVRASSPPLLVPLASPLASDISAGAEAVLMIASTRRPAGAAPVTTATVPSNCMAAASFGDLKGDDIADFTLEGAAELVGGDVAPLQRLFHFCPVHPGHFERPVAEPL